MNIAEIVAEYPNSTHVCLGCGDPYTLDADAAYTYYCDNTMDCTWPRWYVVADGSIIEED